MIRPFFFSFFLFCCSFLHAASPLEEAQQLMLVTTSDWDAQTGVMHRFERDITTGEWVPYEESMPVVVGKKGLGWGRGEHSASLIEGPTKREGDLKGPAGIFTLGTAFGHTASRHLGTVRMPYYEITPHSEAVDDPFSIYYNQIVDKREAAISDWESSEKMGMIPLYLRGVVINHNMKEIDIEKGSHIFLHMWRLKDWGTAGCTALSPSSMEKIFYWLDAEKKPLIIQLPEEAYQKALQAWDLPKIPGQLVLSAKCGC